MFYFWIRRRIFLRSVRHFLFTSLLPFLPLFFYTCLSQSLFNPNIFFHIFSSLYLFFLLYVRASPAGQKGPWLNFFCPCRAFRWLCATCSLSWFTPALRLPLFYVRNLKIIFTSLNSHSPVRLWAVPTSVQTPAPQPNGKPKSGRTVFFLSPQRRVRASKSGHAYVLCRQDRLADWPTGRLADWEGGGFGRTGVE